MKLRNCGFARCAMSPRSTVDGATNKKNGLAPTTLMQFG